MFDFDAKLKWAGIGLAVLGGVLVYRTLFPATNFAADGTDPQWDAAAERCHGQPAVVLFTADWCGACRALHERVLSDSSVQMELQNHYGFYAVNLTNAGPATQKHAQKFGVRGIPCLIRYDANGKETARTNYLPADQMVKWLKAGE